MRCTAWGSAYTREWSCHAVRCTSCGSWDTKKWREANNFEGEGIKNFGESENRPGCFPKEGYLRSGKYTPSWAACNPHKWSKQPIVPCAMQPATHQLYRWRPATASASPQAGVLGHLPIPQRAGPSFPSLWPWKKGASSSQLAAGVLHQHQRVQILNLKYRWCWCYYRCC